MFICFSLSSNHTYNITFCTNIVSRKFPRYETDGLIRNSNQDLVNVKRELKCFIVSTFHITDSEFVLNLRFKSLITVCNSSYKQNLETVFLSPTEFYRVDNQNGLSIFISVKNYVIMNSPD